MSTDTTTQPTGTDAAASRLRETLENVTNSRWLAIRRALGLTTDEILDDSAVMLVVVANEQHRAEHGNDSWTRYLEMTPRSLQRHLGLDDNTEVPTVQLTPVELQEREEAEDDSKSGDPAGGGAAGAGAVPGPDVPGPGDHA